jgi:hypothetical protein
MGRKEGNLIHGLRYAPEYPIWNTMKQRCLNPNNKKYPNYGGRGITVCDEWLKSFVNFYVDMGPSPSKKHSIERIDNNKGYSKDNCRWATNTEQSRNRRSNKYFEYNGTLFMLSDLCKLTGVNINTFLHRIRRGWTVEKAADTSPYCYRSREFRYVSIAD